MDNKDFTYEDFICYCLIYATDANLEIEAHEKEYIEGLFGESRYTRVLKAFNEDNDYQSVQRMIALRDHFFKAVGGEDYLFEGIEKVFKSDGNYDQVEHQTMEILRKVFA